MDMSNLAMSCRPLSQTSEVTSSQVFLSEHNILNVHTCLRPDDASLCTLIVSGPAFDATGEPLPGMLKQVQSHKIHLQTATLVTGVRLVWSVEDSNGGNASILMQVECVTGFNSLQMRTQRTHNTSRRLREQLCQAVETLTQAIACMYGKAAGPCHGVDDDGS